MKLPFKKKQFNYLLAFMLGSIFSLFFALLFENKSKPNQEEIISTAQKSLIAKEENVKASLTLLRSELNTQNTSHLFSGELSEKMKEMAHQGIFILVYEHDSLIFWNDNSASIEEYMMKVCLDNPLAKLSNGYFQVIRENENFTSSRKIFGLILLKSNYPYQNKYLENKFAPWLNFSSATALIDTPEKARHALFNSDGNFVFGIGELIIPNQSNAYYFFTLFFYFLFLILLIGTFYKFLFYLLPFKNSPINALIWLSFLIFTARFVMIYFRVPEVFYDEPLVDFTVFGDSSSFFNANLPNVILNSLLLFFLCIKFYATKFEAEKISKVQHQIFTGVLFLLSVFYSCFISNLFFSFVENSSVSFDVTYLFKLSSISVVIFILFGLLFFSYYLLIEKTIFILHSRNFESSKIVTYFFFCFCIQIFISNFLCEDWVSLMWPALTLLLIYFLRKRSSSYTLSFGIVFVLWFSGLTAYYFIKHETRKEAASLKVYAERLVSSKDEVAENLFVDVRKKIKADPELNRMLFSNPVPSLSIEQRLRQYYFRGYWEKYKITVSAIDSICTPLFKNENPLYENNTFFDDQITDFGAETISPDLYFISDRKNSGALYIGRVTVNNSKFPDRKPSVFYFLFQSRLETNGNGFPELLLDKSINTNKALSDYSFAHFKNGQLQQMSGDISIDKSFLNYSPNPGKFISYSSGILYFPIRVDAENTVVIAKYSNTFSVAFTGYSYFFMFYSLLLWIFLFVRELTLSRVHGSSSLSNKVQLLIVSVVLLALVGTGIGAFYFIQKQFEQKNKIALDEKMRGVLKELQADLGEQVLLRQNYKEYAAYLLQNFSTIFNTDISLFDAKGNLFASSQPKLYEEGIISNKMNPVAFSLVSFENKDNFVIKENVGRLNYFSAYRSLLNKDGRLLAYINLPYFSKQSELEKEISTYFVTLINIFVALFAASTLMGIFISSQITRPLRILQASLSKVRLGSSNEALSWPDNDEIGKLVNEYNFMIDELGKSAERLAKSEREGAWREMAKQVAHEIKNPLTPMKLSIQHLVRISETSPQDFPERVRAVSAMLVEQIETLTSIASSFSEFAKLPMASATLVNLNEFLENYIFLYKSEEDFAVSLTAEQTEKLYVSIDKDHLMRILNNLVKNAIQSLVKDRKGVISITLNKVNHDALLIIRDNGMGIPISDLKNIFIPNFSTKTDGMGLGLAMVKSMIESAGGTITCESEENHGSSFFVQLPLTESPDFQS